MDLTLRMRRRNQGFQSLRRIVNMELTSHALLKIIAARRDAQATWAFLISTSSETIDQLTRALSKIFKIVQQMKA